MVLAIEGGASADQSFRVIPALSVEENFTSNVFFSETGSEADYVTRIAPKVEARYKSDRDSVRLRAALNSSSYVRNPDLNGISYAGELQFERALSSRLTLDLDGGYRFYPRLDAVTEADQQIQSARPDLAIWDVNSGLRFQQSARASFGGDLGYSSRGYGSSDSIEAETQRAHQSTSGNFFYQWISSSRDLFDFTLSLNHTHYADTGAGAENDSYGVLSAQWSRTWTPEWSTMLSGGVLALYSNPTGFPSETRVGFTGGALVQRQTQRSRTYLGYSNRIQPSSGVGSTLEVHTLRGGLFLDPIRDLTVRLEGSWQLYKSASDGPVRVGPASGGCAPGQIQAGPSCFEDSSLQVDSELTFVAATLDWRLREHWATFLRYRFRHQTSSGEIDVAAYTEHRFILGVRYALPLELF